MFIAPMDFGTFQALFAVGNLSECGDSNIPINGSTGSKFALYLFCIDPQHFLGLANKNQLHGIGFYDNFYDIYIILNGRTFVLKIRN
jgi:hypothetical protein